MNVPAHVISFLYKKIIPSIPFWVIQKFQSPSHSGGVLDGDGKNSIGPPYDNHGNKKISITIEGWLVASF
jgi:hypothetical protein